MLDIDKIGLKVGLEIHQQLATNKKLFCNCAPLESDEFMTKFSRKLRASKSEMGKHDPAALFESNKAKKIVYYANPNSSCLVEQDEEPPHELDCDAKNIALIIATALKSSIFNEIYPMRKTVIDGSNTSGFQRTMLVSQGGVLEANGRQVGVQSICLEEDAAKLLEDNGSIRKFSLDRLGIPLVEIALEPISATPEEMKKIALSLGRLLRTTKKVARGLGSIRQDVNVSVSGSGIVEVKGVQQLDQLEKVVDYEAKRQHGLLKIAEKLNQQQIKKISKHDVFDIAEDFKNCKSKIIQQSLKENAQIKVIKIKNFAGMFGFSPYEGIRLGKEIGQMVRFYGIGGVFHSDELPKYGIKEFDVKIVNKKLDLCASDGFIIIAGPNSKINYAIESIIERIEQAKCGVPAETRVATQSGETVYLRPRPGASRMYPETDIPPLMVTKNELEIAKQNIPKSWDESLRELKEKYQLNSQLSEQIFDSEYLEIFEKVCSNKKISPNFVASQLCSTITNLQRKGFDAQLLKPTEIISAFNYLVQGKIAKESMEIVFESIMSGKSKSVQEAMQNASISRITDEELSRQIEKIVNENGDLVKNQGSRAIDPLMGIVMKNLRGKVSGEKVNQFLQQKIRDFQKNKS